MLAPVELGEDVKLTTFNFLTLTCPLMPRLKSEVSYFESEDLDGEGFGFVRKRRRGAGDHFEEEDCQATLVLAPNICYLR